MVFFEFIDFWPKILLFWYTIFKIPQPNWYYCQEQSSWGKVSLYHIPHGGDNQKWKIVDGNVICKYQDLRLDIAMGSGGPGGVGANVGCCKKNYKMNQQWEILVSSIHVSTQ